MPKNYGQGVAVDLWRAGRLRNLVRLGRVELWTRLDRNMARSGDTSGPDDTPYGHHRDAAHAG